MKHAAAEPPLAMIYVRVSTGKQVSEGHSIESQTAALEVEAAKRGYRTEVVQELGKSAGKVTNRPALRGAMDRLDKGQAQALFALDLDRLSRSVSDLAMMLSRAQRKGWQLVVVGMGGIDTTTPEGQLVAHTLAAAAQYERAMISKRVRRQHEARRERGVTWGVDQGPQPILSDHIRERIATEHQAGSSLRAIAAGLSADGIPTARGGQWHASTVKAVLTSIGRAA
ncbi:MAG: recombinase family protein [Actinomycetes bacterium]